MSLLLALFLLVRDGFYFILHFVTDLISLVSVTLSNLL